ncbi:hypothetical protein B0H14DRAFT_2557283 [Mycena olivaceomarginata]|nr:hypothetical protein B0H14DRAFT_2557283 [Mycena olivaceomarginata]
MAVNRRASPSHSHPAASPRLCSQSHPIRLIPPAQDMDVDEEEEEEEEETLLGSSNSELTSELFPPDDDSGPEEEEQHLTPPASLTQVTARIRDHVSKYLDDQAEDSDEEAEEEHEGEEEMKEDRDFVDDTAVNDNFVHRLPSNKDDASKVQKWVAHFQNVDKVALYKRDMAREAAGEAGPSICAPHVRHLRQVPFDLNMFFSPILRTMRPLVEARFFPSDILYGMQEPEPPSNPHAVTYRGAFRSDTEKGPAPPRSTTPTPANVAVWASQWQPPLEGEDTGLWLCLPELAFKRLDMQKTSAAVRNCEGRKGWVLPTSAIPRDTKKVDVHSIGKNGTMHPINKSCVKPLHTDDEGHPLGETAQRVIVIGPDVEGLSSRPGEYAQVVPLALHDYSSAFPALSEALIEARALFSGYPEFEGVYRTGARNIRPLAYDASPVVSAPRALQIELTQIFSPIHQFGPAEIGPKVVIVQFKNNGRYVQSARTRAVRTNDNKSRSRPWSGFVAASTAPRPPSTPAHNWIDDYETKAASLSAEVSEAKAIAEGDPTNTAKSTAANYTEQFGLLEPNTDVSSYIARRTRREYQMGELRHRAISDSCPFTNPGPLNAYYKAAAAFDHDFGHKYEATDEYKDRLSTKHKLRDIYKKILDLPEDRRTQLVGQQAFSTSLQNLFPKHDLRRVTFDNKLRDRVAFYTRSTADSFAPTLPTLHRTTIHLVFRNPWYAEPLSIKCIRQYCKHTMWFEELEAMEAEARCEARRRALPPPIPTHTFYGAVDTALH